MSLAPPSLTAAPTNTAEDCDVLLFSIDTCATLAAFFSAFPGGRPEAEMSHAHLAPARLYDTLLAPLAARANSSSSNSSNGKSTKSKISNNGKSKTSNSAQPTDADVLLLLARAERGVRQALEVHFAHLYWTPLTAVLTEAKAMQDAASVRRREELESALIATLHALLDHERCVDHLRRHNTLRPLLDDLQRLGVDAAQLGFAKAALVADECALDDELAELELQATHAAAATGSAAAAAEPASSDGNTAASAASGSTPASSSTLTAQVAQVQSIFPDFGEGFVRACLAALGGGAEGVINAVLEDRLPAAIDRLPRDMAVEEQDGHNVFGHAEADTAPLDISRLHRGKMCGSREREREREANMMRAGERDGSQGVGFGVEPEYSVYRYPK